jgi:hypothetical protein
MPEIRRNLESELWNFERTHDTKVGTRDGRRDCQYLASRVYRIRLKIETTPRMHSEIVDAA